MKQNIAWPIAAVVGLGIVVLGLGSLSAQRDRPFEGMRPAMQPGRFAVAHATADGIVILDTTTGQLYEAKPKDFRPYSELPKVGQPDRPRIFDRDKDRAKDKEPIRRDKDRERPRERDKDAAVTKDKAPVKPDRD